MATSFISHQLEVGPVISLVEVSYNTPIPSARTEKGQEAYPTAIGSFSHYVDKPHPSTGNLIEGWHWDERIWSAEGFENDEFLIPNNWDPTTSGITTSYFQSGVGSGDDLKLEDILFINASGVKQNTARRIWAPEINHGYYYDFDEEGYLFSDDSQIERITFSGVVLGITHPTISGFNTVTLTDTPKVGIPITIQQFRWNESLGQYDIVIDARKRIEFTGLRDSNNVRLPTYDSNKKSILWENIDPSEPEFIVTFSGIYPEIILNDQYVEEVGGGVIPSGLETLGTANGEANQQFHLEYAPVDNTMPIRIYSYITASGLTQWEPIDFDITPSGQQVRVDYDLGIIEFGDPDLVNQQIPPAGSTIAAQYYKTLQVEYEPEDTNNTVVAIEANVNQIYRREPRGFIYLSTQLEDPTSITLSAELPTLQANSFGPLFIGNAFAPLVATVKDSNGQVLEGQTVTFFITSTPTIGGFGAADTIRSVTDQFGDARAFYNPPRSINDIGENIEASNWNTINFPVDPILPSGLAQVTVLHTENLLIEGTTQDIFLYEVHVDDAIQGILNVTLDQNDLDAQLTDYYEKFFQEQDIWGPTGLNPSTSGISTNAQQWESDHRNVWNLVQPQIFRPNAGLGRKQIVAEFDATALDPHDFTTGAIAPVQPIAVESTGAGEYDVYFDSSTYSIPKPTGTDTVPSGTLHSYFLVAPTTITIQASVFNQRLNQNILSNEITIRLSIPPYLSGQWIIDAINDSHIDEISANLAGIVADGQRAPLGFRLRSSTVTLAGAIDGVTFLDVNPKYDYDPYNTDYELDDPTTYSGVWISHQITVSGIVES